MRKVVVAALAELPPGARRRVIVDGRAIVIFNVDNRLYALRDVCPHRGAQLSQGVVTGGALTASQPGAYDYDPGRSLLKCPWHGWEFDLATGQSWVDPQRTRVRAYGVAVERGRKLAATTAEPGPYIADTVPVSVEDDYVVLTIEST